MSIWLAAMADLQSRYALARPERLAHFALACAKHVWDRYHRFFAKNISSGHVNTLTASMSACSLLIHEDQCDEECKQEIANLQLILPDEDSDEDLVLGWDYMIRSVIYVYRTIARDDPQVSSYHAAFNSYQVVVDHEMHAHFESHGGVLDEQGIRNLELNSAPCSQELQFQISQLEMASDE